MITTATISFRNTTYTFNPAMPLDISTVLKPGDDTVNCFWAEEVAFDTIRVGDFVGSVAEGGACNYKRVHVTPHGNGTHTECYGHISPDPAATIQHCLQQFLFFAQVVSVQPKLLLNGDSVVTLQDFKQHITDLIPEAIVLRTLPNEKEKLTRHYSGTNPTYLDPALAAFLAENKIKHLLLDLPSVDREEDGGQLLAHKAFWQFPFNTRRQATITELIYVSDYIEDGFYLLNLQIASLELDASPSKPVLYRLNRQ